MGSFRFSHFTIFLIIAKMASQYESYHGMQVAKEAFLEVIMTLQPARMYLRAIVPLLLIQIGKDNEAYNFIKFWLKNTPKGIEVYKGFYCCFPLFSQYNTANIFDKIENQNKFTKNII